MLHKVVTCVFAPRINSLESCYCTIVYRGIVTRPAPADLRGEGKGEGREKNGRSRMLGVV